MKTKLSKCSLTLPLGGWGAGLLLFFILLFSCKSKDNNYDASGYFEAVETIVSAQANGQILSLNVDEGQELAAGQQVGQIDSTQIYLTLQQVQSQRGAVLSRKPDIGSQTAVLKEQITTAKRELARVERLAAGNAATQKQMDDARSAVAVLQKQLDAQQTSLSNASSSVSKEGSPLEVQMSLLKDQLNKTHIINPVNGTVLVKYVEQNEMASMGKPLYKIADLSEIILRAYITNTQLANLKLGQKVTVLVDKGKDKNAEYQGNIEWISSKAEFTPKTIQTKDERSNEVYAIKIRVKNDGFLKIGMYGDVKF
ncbi:MAG TPA: HlyD family efflux transporter periplasmic adaptor subunit [Paludibacteraceae bacterium]|jgi:HlyD family secretion protein|nr:HlyD family efflux transporter periplasmic adaptor subunit [Paludibacteraceae bacterium]